MVVDFVKSFGEVYIYNSNAIN